MSFLPYAVAAWLFVIGLYGIVTSRNLVHLVVCLSVVQSSTVNSPSVEQCIAGAVRRWEFPKPQGGGIVIVTYPFVFTQAGQ